MNRAHDAGGFDLATLVAFGSHARVVYQNFAPTSVYLEVHVGRMNPNSTVEPHFIPPHFRSYQHYPYPNRPSYP